MRLPRFVAASAALLCAGAAHALPVETTTDLNLRSAPGVGAPAIAVMPRGEIVHVDVCRGEWCLVYFRGYPGWANARHLARLTDRPPWEGAGRARFAFPFDEPAMAPSRRAEPYVVPLDEAPWVEPLDGPRRPPSAAPRFDVVPSGRSRSAAIDPMRPMPMPPRRPDEPAASSDIARVPDAVIERPAVAAPVVEAPVVEAPVVEAPSDEASAERPEVAALPETPVAPRLPESLAVPVPPPATPPPEPAPAPPASAELPPPPVEGYRIGPRGAGGREVL